MSGLLIVERSVSPEGRIYVEVRRRGELVDVMHEKNLIVSGASAVFASLLGGTSQSVNAVTQIGFGTNGTAPASGNSSLTGAYTKAIDSVTYPVAGTVQFNFSLGTGEDNGMAILEFGLFTAAGTLVSRRVRSSALNKGTDVSLTGNWQIVF